MPGNITTSGNTLIVGQILLSLISLILLVFTSLLSYYSYSAQARAGIRESLEQLDDVEINNRLKIKPILHSFDFGPVDPKSVLLIKIYRTQYNEAAASVPEKATNQLENEDIEEAIKALKEIDDTADMLEDYSFNCEGVFLELSTRNAVAIRRFANQAMTELRNKMV